MIDVSYVVLEDSLRVKNPAANITEGQPVKLNAAGEVVAATADAPVYGIAKVDSNGYNDFTGTASSAVRGQYGAYGSGKLTIVLSGIVRVKASTYNTIEVDQTGSTASAVTVKVYDDALSYVPGDVLYVDANGLITKTASNKASIFGKVISAPTSDGWLEILVEPMIATAAAQLA